MSKPIAVDDANFEQKVLKSETPVLVDFWAPWCRPCLMVAPVLEELAEEYGGRITIAKMDVDQNAKTAAKYSIMAIPTLIIFKKGKPVSQIVGFKPKAELKRDLDAALQIKTMTEKIKQEYEVIIIGGGPAGLTAGLYTSRARLSSLLIERGLVGGQIADAEHVENYPGFAQGIAGFELGQLIYQQATKYGLKTIIAEATGIELKGEKKVVKTTKGNFIAKAVIIASGSERRKLGIPGEEKLTGKGVSYCATCDGPFFKEKPVAVVGGGNAAITEALHLAKFASRVIVIHRRDQLRATRILEERARPNPK